MDPAGKRGEGEPLVDKVNLRLSVIREQTRVGPGAVGQPTWGWRVGGTSYNPLNKADHPTPGADCVFNQPHLLSNTSALSFFLSLSCPTPTKKDGSS